MSLTAKENTTERKKVDPVTEGLHNAVCYLIVDAGTHYDQNYDKMKHEIYIGWEIPKERIKVEHDGKEEDKPRVISKSYTLSLNEKANLRKDLEAWRGKRFTEEELDGFDLKNVLGAPAMLQVMHKKGKADPSRIYANVENVLPLNEEVKAENEHIWFSLEEGKEIPEGVYGWMRDKIEESEEMKGEPKQSDAQYDQDGKEIEFRESAGDSPEDENLPF